MSNDSQNYTLDQWLSYISAVHPREIELGLSRIKSVAKALGLAKVAPQIVTIAGTNGKGSCVAYLESLLEASSIRTAAYTSPHLQHFNERIRVGGKNVSDAEICTAFHEIDMARGSVSLSYFEFATLAALWIFSHQPIDVALLEVGLGGRLDAVNLVDPDVAVITSIALDHQDWLGSDLEVIGFEKAGIMRPGIPTVFADFAMPDSIQNRAEELGSSLYRFGRDFQLESVSGKPVGIEIAGTGAGTGATKLQFKSDTGREFGFSPAALSSHIHLGSLAACFETLQLLDIDFTAVDIGLALARINLPGRFERRIDGDSQRELILDVAHNPAAAKLLNERLQTAKQANLESGRVIMVLAVLKDKDIEGIVVSLQSSVDIWYIAQNDDERALGVDDALERLNKTFPNKLFHPFKSVKKACEAACAKARETDQVVVAGSFHTVAIARAHSRAA